jgi:hypothetical protein
MTFSLGYLARLNVAVESAGLYKLCASKHLLALYPVTLCFTALIDMALTINKHMYTIVLVDIKSTFGSSP